MKIRITIYALIFAILAPLAIAAGMDGNKKLEYEHLTVVDKLQGYSYSKNGSVQINRLLVKNAAGKLEDRVVDVATHYTSKVGQTLAFVKSNRETAYFRKVLKIYLILGVSAVIFIIAELIVLNVKAKEAA